MALLGTAALGFLVATGTIALARHNDLISPVWPLNALLVLLAFQVPARLGLPVAAAGLAGAAAANIRIGDPWQMILGYGVGNAALVAATILALEPVMRRGLAPLRWPRLALRCGLPILAALAVAAGVSAAGLQAARGVSPLTSVPISLSANLLGLLILLPFGLLRRALADRRRWPAWRKAAFDSSLLMLGGTVALVFHVAPGLPLGVLLLPAQLLVTLVGGLVGALVSTLVVALAGVPLTSLGEGYMARMVADPIQRMQLLQLVLALNGTVVLAVALLLERDRRAIARIRSAHRGALEAGAAQRNFARIVHERLVPPLRRTLEGRTDAGDADAVQDLRQALTLALDAQAHAAARRHLAPSLMRPIEVRALLEEVRAELRPLAAERRVDLHIAGTAGRAVGDAPGLRETLLILGRNAVQYRCHDTGQVRFWVEARDGLVRIGVDDDGAGIPPGLVPRLFRPYDRLGLEQDPVPGSGLGLSTARRLMTRMGGRIGFEPAASLTRFVVELPATAGVAPAPLRDEGALLPV